MASRRQKRVAELLHHELSTMIQFNTKDPRIGFCTITGVEITPDLKTATVYVSVLSGDTADTLTGLTSAAPFFRRELGRILELRLVPDLHFKPDNSIAYGLKIDTILSGIEIPPELPDTPADTGTPTDLAHAE